MKFLEDDKLAQLTAELTDAVLLSGGGNSGSGGGFGGDHPTSHGGGTTTRVINGRIEAYTMKRVSSDKKYAHRLGEKYMQEISVVEEEMARFQRSLGLDSEQGGVGGGVEGTGGGSARRRGRRRAASVEDWKFRPKSSASASGGTKTSGDADAAKGAAADTTDAAPRDSSTSPKLTGKSGPGGSRAGRKPDKTGRAGTSRRRSKSLDIGGVAMATAAAAAGKVTFGAADADDVKGAGASDGGSRASGTAKGAGATSPPRSIMRRDGRHRSSSFDIPSFSRRSTSDAPTALGAAGGAGAGAPPPAALHSYGYFTNSSLGDFHEMSTRRLMTDLILTLNASFPDYDFSTVRPDHFVKMKSANVAVNRVNERLSEFAATCCGGMSSTGNTALHAGVGGGGGGGAGTMGGGDGFYHPYGSGGYGYAMSSSSSSRDGGGAFLQKLWSAVDDVIVLNDCDVYSYVPPAGDNDDDPMGFLTETLTGYEEVQDGGARLGRAGGVGVGVGGSGAGGSVAASSAAMKSSSVTMDVMAEATASGGPSLSSSSSPPTDRIRGFTDQTVSPSNSGDGGTVGAGLGATAVTASMPLWTFNYFFVNKSLKRIVLFACVQTMRNEVQMDVDDDMDDVVGVGGDAIPLTSRPTADGNGVMASTSSPDVATPSRYGYDDADDADSPPTGIARGGGGGRRQLLGPVSTGLGSESAAGYYSVSSTDARTDDEFDQFDTGNLAEDVSRPPTPATPVMG